MSKVSRAIYGWLASIALILGFMVALIFLVALIVGGDFGADAANIGGQIMAGGIVVAAVAVAGGLLWMYLTGQHALQLEKPSRPDKSSPGEESSSGR